jgi:phosphoribosylamine--glycine ligase
VGASLAEARDKSYATLEAIQLEGSHYRQDIALKASQTNQTAMVGG